MGQQRDTKEEHSKRTLQGVSLVLLSQHQDCCNLKHSCRGANAL